MNDNNYAKGLHVFLYILICAGNLILARVDNAKFGVMWLSFVVYFIATIVILAILAKKDRVSSTVHLLVSGVMMLEAAWTGGMHAGNMAVYYILALLPLVSLMLYMNIKAYSIFLVVYFAQFILSCIMPLYYIRFEVATEIKLMFLLISCSFAMIMHYYIKLMGFRERYNAEQDKSYEDLQKVVMAKCIEAKAATKSKSDFLSNMSHEIRTPLNAILGMNEMILRENRDDNIAKYAGNVDRSGQMLLALINDILDFSRIESGKLELSVTEYSFYTVIRDIINMLESRIRAKELKLDYYISSDIPKTFFGDDIRIKQIITNVMTNAVKYTEKGGVIIRAEMCEELSDNRAMLKVTISDSGQGMSKENLKLLFDSFSRFNIGKNRQIEGTGLGMAITKRLIDAMEGYIEVESEIGLGSTFTIYVPQEIGDATPSGEFAINRVEKADVKKRDDFKFVRPDLACLVVDDSKVNLAVAKGLLKYSKMQVKTCNSGYECLDLLKDHRFDIILLDHMMPGMDGIKTLQRIREDNLAKDVPIIALTANAIGNARDAYLDAGFDDYLSKPISSSHLEELMRKWLGENKN